MVEGGEPDICKIFLKLFYTCAACDNFFRFELSSWLGQMVVVVLSSVVQCDHLLIYEVFCKVWYFILQDNLGTIMLISEN